jgi:hypothetical protein
MELIKAKELALELMKFHGLTEKGWRFEFDNAKRRFGVCRYRTKTIGLSKHLVSLNEVARVKNTILHEIAHALTPGHHHDFVWRTKAIEIGCDGNRCYSSDEVERPQGNFIAVCVGCGHEHYKFRTPKRTSSCGKCSRVFNPNTILKWERVKNAA